MSSSGLTIDHTSFTSFNKFNNSMRVKVSTAFVSLATTANRRSEILRASSTLSRNETALKPFFRIYYNDVYEVNLPPRHRFPMNKYAQVRRKLQEMVNELSEEQRITIDCGESPFLRRLELSVLDGHPSSCIAPLTLRILCVPFGHL